MKYKIGDKIKIRSDLIGDRRYDELYFPKEMEVYNGNSVIVTGITEDYTYKLTNISELEWDDLILESWEWNDKMIEGIIKVVKKRRVT